jgi:hypothetical protein
MRIYAAWGYLAFLLLACPADADVLKLPRGVELHGTVRDATFLSKGIQTKFPRDEISRLTLGDDGKDVIELLGEISVEGKLVSVTFRSAHGLRPVARKDLTAVAIEDESTFQAKKPETPKDEMEAEEDESDLTPEQREALARNLALYRTYMAKVAELKKTEHEELKSKYMSQAKRVVDEALRLDRQIVQKRRRREQASRSGSSYRTTNSSRNRDRDYESEYERLCRTDGLEKDERALEQARKKGAKLKKTIRDKEREIRDRAEKREARVRFAGLKFKKAILEGNDSIPAEDKMTEKYEAALKVDGTSTKKK